ncbi:hypothetical protein BH10PSE3_BH10PSE3_14660 [soil metagenome]
MLHMIFAAAMAASTPNAVTPPPPAPISAGVKADQKLGCAVVFVGFDEIVRGNPGLISKFDDGDGSSKAIAPMLKMLGVSGEAIINDILTQAVAKGEKPTDVYRRGIASLSAMVANAPVTKKGDAANQERGVAIFTDCLSLMTE